MLLALRKKEIMQHQRDFSQHVGGEASQLKNEAETINKQININKEIHNAWRGEQETLAGFSHPHACDKQTFHVCDWLMEGPLTT